MTKMGQGLAVAVNGRAGAAFQGLKINRPVDVQETGRVIATYCIGKLTGGREGLRSSNPQDCPFLEDFACA